MIKNLIKFGIFLIILLLTLVFYLSYFGIDTKKFNSHISEKLTKTDPNLRIELKKVKQQILFFIETYIIVLISYFKL